MGGFERSKSQTRPIKLTFRILIGTQRKFVIVKRSGGPIVPARLTFWFEELCRQAGLNDTRSVANYKNREVSEL